MTEETKDNDGCLHCALGEAIGKTVMEFYSIGEDDAFDSGDLVDALAEVIGDLVSRASLDKREQLIMMVEATIREKIDFIAEEAREGGTN